MNNNPSFILKDINAIKNFISQVSSEMFDYINNKLQSNFILFYKHITHADLAVFGKSTHTNSYDKNLLYYMKTKDMIEIENNTKKPFCTSHQSCINLKSELYDIVGLSNPRKKHIYKINDYMNVYIVNKNMNFFTAKYTKKIFNKLNKKISNNSKSWDFNNLDIKLSNGVFTSIDIHIAVHGLGIKQDIDFHKIRHHIFKGDTIILLFELTQNILKDKNKINNNVFILFEKNPIFFNLIGETNLTYAKYQEQIRKQLIYQIIKKDNKINNSEIDVEVTRQQQNSWRNMLANEMMAYTQIPKEIFCPFTYIIVNFDNLGSLFIASHIKGFSDSNTTNEEKYDINNGILMCANINSLFDKHLISIDENKKIIFSFLLNDNKLKQQLLLTQSIFIPILNEKRMEYLSYHRSIFKIKEKERRKQVNNY